MALTTPILERFAQESIALIGVELDKKGFRGKPSTASGKTKASLQYVVSEEELVIYGAGHIFAVEFGRGPSKGKGSGESLKDRIRHWIDDKGIVPDGISKDSLAFLIARKIHKEGTLLYQMKRQSGVLSTAINQQRVDTLATNLMDVFVPYAVSELLKDIREN